MALSSLSAAGRPRQGLSPPPVVRTPAQCAGQVSRPLRNPCVTSRRAGVRLQEMQSIQSIQSSWTTPGSGDPGAYGLDERGSTLITYASRHRHWIGLPVGSLQAQQVDKRDDDADDDDDLAEQHRLEAAG